MELAPGLAILSALSGPMLLGLLDLAVKGTVLLAGGVPPERSVVRRLRPGTWSSV